MAEPFQHGRRGDSDCGAVQHSRHQDSNADRSQLKTALAIQVFQDAGEATGGLAGAAGRVLFWPAQAVLAQESWPLFSVSY